jgi:hypothetical protein
MEQFYAAKREAARLHAEAVAIDLSADFSDHDTPTIKKSVTVIDLTADSDHETPAPKKRKLKKTDKKADKKAKNFSIVFKFEGVVQRTLNQYFM